MRGVYLHVLGDALGSVIVIISALIIKYASGKWTIYVDPGMSIISCGVLHGNVRWRQVTATTLFYFSFRNSSTVFSLIEPLIFALKRERRISRL